MERGLSKWENGPMIATGTTPILDQPFKDPTRLKRVLRKWSLGVTAVLMTYLMWQCSSGLLQGRALSNAAVEHFHEQLNSGQYQEIFDEADDAFRASDNQQELLKFLAAVHAKLGAAGSESLSNIQVNANTNGTFVTTRYTTVFTRGQAFESFTWVKRGDRLNLYRYNVQSKALIMN
jgi:hypothetical protein